MGRSCGRTWRNIARSGAQYARRRRGLHPSSNCVDRRGISRSRRHGRLHGACPAQLLAALARPIEDRLAITLSIGWSDTELLPKIASDLDKPRSFSVLNRSEAAVFLAGQAGYDAEGRYAPRLPGDGSTEIGQPCDPPTLFNREPDRPRRIEHAMNQIRTRLGEGSVRVGRSLRAPARRHCGAA